MFKDLKGPLTELEEARIYTEKIIKKKGKNLKFKFIGETLTFFEIIYSYLIIFLFLFVFII